MKCTPPVYYYSVSTFYQRYGSLINPECQLSPKPTGKWLTQTSYSICTAPIFLFSPYFKRINIKLFFGERHCFIAFFEYNISS